MGREAVLTDLLTLQAAVQRFHVEDTQHVHTSVLKHFASNSYSLPSLPIPSQSDTTADSVNCFFFKVRKRNKAQLIKTEGQPPSGWGAAGNQQATIPSSVLTSSSIKCLFSGSKTRVQQLLCMDKVHTNNWECISEQTMKRNASSIQLEVSHLAEPSPALGTLPAGTSTT